MFSFGDADRFRQPGMHSEMAVFAVGPGRTKPGLGELQYHFSSPGWRAMNVHAGNFVI